MTTGEIIKDLLHKTGRKQIELARFLGVSSNTVNRWIPTAKKQGIEPSGENIRKIAEFFDVSTDIITGVSGKYGSEEHKQFVHKKAEKWKAFECLLETFGYEIENDSYQEDTNSIEPPTEFILKWNGDERYIKAVDFDLLLKRMEKHIRIEIEDYY